MANDLSSLVSPVSIKRKRKDTHLILEARSDEFEICKSKVISKKEWLGLKEKKIVVHRRDTEGWEITYL